MIISLFDWEENIVGKGENAGYQHFLLYPQCFQKTSYSGLCSEELNIGVFLLTFRTSEFLLHMFASGPCNNTVQIYTSVSKIPSDLAQALWIHQRPSLQTLKNTNLHT